MSLNLVFYCGVHLTSLDDFQGDCLGVRVERKARFFKSVSFHLYPLEKCGFKCYRVRYSKFGHCNFVVVL